MERVYSVYLLASGRNGTLYCGVTNDLAGRAYEHKNHVGSQFTARYKIHLLVWYEHYSDVTEAITREKQIKH
jgi:putative endonuclease